MAVADARIRGVAAADEWGADYYLFAEAHMRVPPDFRKRCEYLAGGADAVWQFRIEDFNGAYINTGARLVFARNRFDLELLREPRTEAFQCDAISGACYLVSRDLYRKHGGWCPLFLGYGGNEEYFSARARQTRTPILCDPATTVKHGYSITPLGTRDELAPWHNRMVTLALMLKDWRDFVPGMGAAAGAWTLVAAKSGQLEVARAANAALWDDTWMLGVPHLDTSPLRPYHYALPPAPKAPTNTRQRTMRGTIGGAWVDAAKRRKPVPQRPPPQPRRLRAATVYPAGQQPQAARTIAQMQRKPTGTVARPADLATTAWAKHVPVIHIGSYAHEQWSVQHMVRACTEREMSAHEADQIGLYHRNVVCWHPHFWRAIKPDSKTGNRVLCVFHHDVLEWIKDHQIVAGIATNRGALQKLQAQGTRKPLHLVTSGGVEDAKPHAVRQHATRKIRLGMIGNGAAGMPAADGKGGASKDLRKGQDLVLGIASRLPKTRYAWVFVGPKWADTAAVLRADGWTVIYPGPLPEPEHYRAYGEIDIYLMLSRIEGGPLPLLETMGCGIWPIATPAGFAPEVIRDGETGALVREYDGQNGTDVVCDVVARVREMNRYKLDAARDAVADSVAHLTWKRFAENVSAVLRATL